MRARCDASMGLVTAAPPSSFSLFLSSLRWPQQGCGVLSASFLSATTTNYKFQVLPRLVVLLAFLHVLLLVLFFLFFVLSFLSFLLLFCCCCSSCSCSCSSFPSSASQSSFQFFCFSFASPSSFSRRGYSGNNPRVVRVTPRCHVCERSHAGSRSDRKWYVLWRHTMSRRVSGVRCAADEVLPD